MKGCLIFLLILLLLAALSVAGKIIVYTLAFVIGCFCVVLALVVLKITWNFIEKL